MLKKELINELELYSGDYDIIYRYEGLEYDNVEIYKYNGKLIFDIDLLNPVETNYLEML